MKLEYGWNGKDVGMFSWWGPVNRCIFCIWSHAVVGYFTLYRIHCVVHGVKQCYKTREIDTLWHVTYFATIFSISICQILQKSPRSSLIWYTVVSQFTFKYRQLGGETENKCNSLSCEGDTFISNNVPSDVKSSVLQHWLTPLIHSHASI